jgi:glycosyltransferase involved in cell wall biosynthesis
MNWPKVSVVIGAYNQQAFVSETVESVLTQTYPNLEIIIADDGSTDNTPAILADYVQKFPDKIKLVLGEKNIGIPGNINRAMALRTGELTAWLDGDDLMLPQKIEKQVALLQNHPQATGCYHDMDVLESETGQILGRMSEVYNGTSQLKQGTLDRWFVPRNYIAPSSIMVYSAACPPHGLDERLKHLSEMLFFAETLRTGQLLAVNEVLGCYRRHAHNVTSDPAARNLMSEYELMVYAILEARYPELYPLLKKLRLSCLAVEAIKAYREGHPARSRQICRNMTRRGALIKGLGLWIGLSLIKPKNVTALTGSQPYHRPGWINRLARFILG